jgi:hypothetical protein
MIFSPTRLFNFITSIQVQRKFSPMAYYVKTLVCPWNVITFLWALLCIRMTSEVGHHMVLVHESNTNKRWKLTRCHYQNKARVWFLIVFLKTYQTPFAHSFHLLGPASTGERDPSLTLGCLVPFAHGVALLCLMTLFQIH